MTNEDSRMAQSAICFAADQIKQVWQEAGREYERPSVVFKPKLIREGDMWCALLGDNVIEGVTGFGENPGVAMWAFDTAWLSKSGTHTIPAKAKP